MSQTHPPNGEPRGTDAAPHANRRKRVTAREVEAVEAENARAARIPADALLPLPAESPDHAVVALPEGHRSDHPARDPDPVPVVDPTTLGRRHRRHGHQRVYRWTQALTLLSALGAGAGVISTMVDEPLAGRILAGIAAGLGVVAVTLSGRTSLSMRWRGWAVAATAFALTALALTWIHGLVLQGDSETAPPPAIRAKSNAS